MATKDGHRNIAERLEAKAARALDVPDGFKSPPPSRVTESNALATLAISHRLAALDLNLQEDLD